LFCHACSDRCNLELEMLQVWREHLRCSQIDPYISRSRKIILNSV
jgi:hypothetical protein